MDDQKIEKKILCFTLMLEFTKIKRIGRGTYGAVYEAKSENTGRHVALKKFLPQDSDDGLHSTTVREIAVIKACDHPGILKCLHVKLKNSNTFLITNLYDCTLREFYQKPFFNRRLLESAVYQITDAVRYLHSVGFIHRDLKPQNIFVEHIGNDNWISVIGDFGLARKYYNTVEPPLMTHEVYTLWYRAPELLLGTKRYSTVTDIWSIGAIFAELILKKPLMAGDSEIDQLMKIFQLFGTPTPDTWEGVADLPDYKPVFPLWTPNGPANFRSKFDKAIANGECNDSLIDFIGSLMTLDPKQRPDIYETFDNKFLETFRTHNNEINATTVANYKGYYEPTSSYFQSLSMFDAQRVSPFHLRFHPDLTPKMLGILIDWLCEVVENFKLLSTTHNRAIVLLYQYLASVPNKPIHRKRLQLLGVCCLNIAAKLEEIYPPDLSDYVYITDNSCTLEQVLEMEREICSDLDFKLISPLHIEFIRLFSSFVLKDTDNDSKMFHTAAKFLLEYSYLNPDLMSKMPAMLSACISYKLIGCALECGLFEEPVSWNAHLIDVSGFTETTITESECWKMFEAYSSTPVFKENNLKLNAAYKKYQIRHFGVSQKIYGDCPGPYNKNPKAVATTTNTVEGK